PKVYRPHTIASCPSIAPCSPLLRFRARRCPARARCLTRRLPDLRGRDWLSGSRIGNDTRPARRCWNDRHVLNPCEGKLGVRGSSSAIPAPPSVAFTATPPRRVSDSEVLRACGPADEEPTKPT